MAYENIPVTVNTAKHKFEMVVDNETAFIDYKQKGDTIYLVHTEVPRAIENRGVASAMVTKTLGYIDEHHYLLVPVCSYVQSYLERHPEWNRLIKQD